MLKRKKAGIKDIALLAKVSIGTVDRVLHNRGRVSPETKKKVEEIIRRTKYKPNIMARSLVINKKYTIGLLIPKYQKDEYWEQAFEGAQSLIAKSEQQGLFIEPYFYSEENRKSFEAVGKKILQSNPDGVIMSSIFLEEGSSLFSRCQDLSIPVIMFDTLIPETQPLTFIGTDSFQGGRVMAELLTLSSDKKGKFAIFHFDIEPDNSPQVKERERGFISYLAEECPDREYIIEIMNNRQHNYDSQINKILQKNNISGIFVTTAKTFYVGLFLRKNKFNGITLVGYDPTNLNRQLLNTGQITFLINQNPRLQVEQSINTFTDYLIYGDSVAPKILFPIEIITRTNLNTYPNTSLAKSKKI